VLLYVFYSKLSTCLIKIPASYRVEWDFSVRLLTRLSPYHFLTIISSAPVSSMESNSIPLKLNTSCVQCRKSKVKCTGGSPCKRCQLSLDPSACTYSASRRRGKRKAADSNAEWRMQPTDASGLHISFDNRVSLTDQLSSSLNEKDATI
jgi:hypothetical protein